jgi:hypothetical protein
VAENAKEKNEKMRSLSRNRCHKTFRAFEA